MCIRPILLLVLAALVISSCATAPLAPRKWSKAGASYDEFLKDRYACILEARGRTSSSFAQGGTQYGPGYGASRSDDAIKANIFLPCMAARGYREDPMGFGPPPGGTVYLQ
jgi:hypothetical protein